MKTYIKPVVKHFSFTLDGSIAALVLSAETESTTSLLLESPEFREEADWDVEP